MLTLGALNGVSAKEVAAPTTRCRCTAKYQVLTTERKKSNTDREEGPGTTILHCTVQGRPQPARDSEREKGQEHSLWPNRRFAHLPQASSEAAAWREFPYHRCWSAGCAPVLILKRSLVAASIFFPWPQLIDLVPPGPVS